MTHWNPCTIQPTSSVFIKGSPFRIYLRLSACLPICVSTYLRIYLSCLSTYLSECKSTYLPLPLPVYLSAYLPSYLATYRPVYLWASVHRHPRSSPTATMAGARRGRRLRRGRVSEGRSRRGGGSKEMKSVIRRVVSEGDLEEGGIKRDQVGSQGSGFGGATWRRGPSRELAKMIVCFSSQH